MKCTHVSPSEINIFGGQGINQTEVSIYIFVMKGKICRIISKLKDKDWGISIWATCIAESHNRNNKSTM